jgi:hypothetical protein
MARRAKHRCECGHSLAYHSPEDNQCHARARVPRAHVDSDDYTTTASYREVKYEDVDCRCQQYVGRKPKGYGVRPLV